MTVNSYIIIHLVLAPTHHLEIYHICACILFNKYDIKATEIITLLHCAHVLLFIPCDLLIWTSAGNQLME